jgi:hypothetical protein
VRWFRFRFNQRRSTRCRYLTCEDRNGDPVMVIDQAGEPVLVPIGRTVTDITDAQARRGHSFLAGLPSLVLEATLKTEATDWFSAGKRRKTNKAQGRRAGAMPGFRRKDSDQRFVCWFNGGRNAVFTKTGRRSGMVTISGANPRTHRAPGRGADGKPHKLGWKVTLHVRLSQNTSNTKPNWPVSPRLRCRRPTPVSVAISAGTQHGRTAKAKRCSDANCVPGRATLIPTLPSMCVRKPSHAGRHKPNNWLGHPRRTRAAKPSARRGARVRPTPSQVRPLGRRHLR